MRVREELGDVFNPRSKLKNKNGKTGKNKIGTDKKSKGEDETWFQIVTESGKHRNENMAVGRNRFQVHPFNFGVDLSEHTIQF